MQLLWIIAQPQSQQSVLSAFWRPEQRGSASMLPLLEKSYTHRKIEGDSLVISQK